MSLVYMQYGDIEGEVSAAGHEKWIMLDSVDFGTNRGITNPIGQTATRETGQVQVSEVHVTRTNDKASQPLFRASLDGKAKDCVIEFTKSNDAGGFETYMQLKLSECLVGSCRTRSDGE